MIDISLVGAGYWGSKIASQLREIDGVGKTEIIDIKDGKSLDDITYDNVILATPAWDHYKQTLELLDKGKNLYVEKPLASTYEECADIKKHLRDQVLLVGHIFLYNDRYRKIKQLIDDGKIGDVKYVESNRLNWGRYQKRIGTLLSLAPHDMSMVADVLGQHELTMVDHKGVRVRDEYTQNDIDTYQFRYNAVDVKFNLSWYYPEKIRHMVFTGTKGIVSWDEEKQTVKVLTDLWKDNWMHYEPTTEIWHIKSNPLKNQLTDFVQSIKQKKQPVSNIDTALCVARNLDLLKGLV